ncbi:TauD/TfdA dioxygenase family protein [Novosphingobium olei]|uniref:TauD/TfdA family dioxygenase n=1 Tax=Novosphingobium olei TaxID=2728851 RepID=A0A7Y0G7R6_9SPHN|nr:TauD/TfdA family dioxygenase [Novosphingobium olei]NML92226.1 TauD/TfdA family dioxygenase [Novosphingobium olei]
MAIEVRPHGRVGAEILGLDLAAIDDEALAQVRCVFAEHGVVFFRDQQISEEQHIAFARRIGPINTNRFFAAHPAHPEIALVIKEPHHRDNIGGGWHTDHSYDAIPALGSILVARELPQSGGATSFASMYAAYEGLPGSLRQRLDNARAVHSARHVFGSKASAYAAASDTRAGRIGNASAADVLEDVIHPAIITHPLSGKRAIYINPGFTTRILGLSDAESDALIAEVFAHCQNPAYHSTFTWQPGSVALWDNRATWHYAHNDYHGQRREMHRITIEGEPLH